MTDIHEKDWGREEWLANTPLYCGKMLVLNAGHRCSMHRHAIKDETFYVSSGMVFLEVGGAQMILVPGESYRVEPGAWHRFWGLAYSVIIEISTHHDESDVERREKSSRFQFGDLVEYLRARPSE